MAGACLGAPTKGGNELHGAVVAWLAAHPHCRPQVYYQQVPAATADGASVGHAFPRALQRTTGWEALLDGRESRTGAARPMLLFCGGSMKLRGARADQLKARARCRKLQRNHKGLLFVVVSTQSVTRSAVGALALERRRTSTRTPGFYASSSLSCLSVRC